MTFSKRLLTVGAAVAAAALLAACHDNRAAAPAAPNTTENFSTFAKQTFAMNESSTPVNFDAIVLVYDVDDDPTAFDSLLM